MVSGPGHKVLSATVLLGCLTLQGLSQPLASENELSAPEHHLPAVRTPDPTDEHEQFFNQALDECKATMNKLQPLVQKSVATYHKQSGGHKLTPGVDQQVHQLITDTKEGANTKDGEECVQTAHKISDRISSLTEAIEDELHPEGHALGPTSDDIASPEQQLKGDHLSGLLDMCESAYDEQMHLFVKLDRLNSKITGGQIEL